MPPARAGPSAAADQRDLFSTQADKLATDIEQLQLRLTYLRRKADLWDARVRGDAAAENRAVEEILRVVANSPTEGLHIMSTPRPGSAMPEIGTVLVTGGTGFVGSHSVARLLRDGIRTRVTVRETGQRAEVPAALRHAEVDQGDRLEFAVADLNADGGWVAASSTPPASSAHSWATGHPPRWVWSGAC